MPVRLRSGPHVWVVAALLSIGAAGCGLLSLRGRPPASHPLQRGQSEPIALTSTRPTRESLRASLADANVVICVVDAARADHVHCYGYPRETTPNIDRLAGEALVFEQHFSQYPHTKPSTASLFTGQYPDTHLIFGQRTITRSKFTMARGLKAAGFETGFFSSSRMASPAMGMGADFDWIYARGVGPARSGPRGRGAPRDLFGARESVSGRSPEALLPYVRDWLRRHRDRRLFAYIHFMPPHQPYRAPEEMRRIFADKKPPYAWQGGFEFAQARPPKNPRATPPLHEWVNLYDAELRWADWAVGEVEKLLRENRLLEKTLFVVTSDHGEALGEHGYVYHVHAVYEEAVHVPLLFRFPMEAELVGRVGALTQSVDLLPTIFELLGVRYPQASVQGRSLVPLIVGETEKVNDFVFARSESPLASYLVRDRRWALILYEDGELRALYDLEADPWQSRNVIEAEPDAAAELIGAFREFARVQRLPPLCFVDADVQMAPAPGAPEVEMSDETRRELRALGYLD